MKINSIKLEDVHKSYNELEVVKGVTLDIPMGSFISIMGESGSGKSTLLSMMSSVMEPTSGRVLYDGVDIYKLPEHLRAYKRCTEIGIVYQFFNLIPTMNVRDNILLPIYLNKGSLKTGRAELETLSKELRISDILNKFPKNLSGGQQQRVAIARSLIYHPDVLFLDEPTGNLDSENTTQIMELLSDIVFKKGVTALQVTHSLQTAKYGNSLIQIKDGRILSNEIIPK